MWLIGIILLGTVVPVVIGRLINRRDSIEFGDHFTSSALRERLKILNNSSVVVKGKSVTELPMPPNYMGGEYVKRPQEEVWKPFKPSKS